MGSQAKRKGNMAESKVPVTMRDFFFDDPFFKRSWDDFDKVRDAMFNESRDMWKRFDEDFRDSACMKNNIMLEPGMELGKEVSKEDAPLPQCSAQAAGPVQQQGQRVDPDEGGRQQDGGEPRHCPVPARRAEDHGGQGVVCVEGRHEEKAEDRS